MKYLISSAVFGLVPVPPEVNCGGHGDDRHGIDQDEQPSQGERPLPKDTERMATEEELARLRRELGINVGSTRERG
jgi:hypothetical protein